MTAPSPRRSPRRLARVVGPAAIVAAVVVACPRLPALAQGTAGDGALEAPWAAMAIALGSVLVAASAALAYLWLLQQRFLAACREAGEITIFALQPAGVPSGTVRSLIALLVIFASIGFAAFTLIQGKPFPEIMSAVLGTVLGFYFGSRTAHGGEGHEVLERIDASHRLRDHAARLRAGLALPERLGGEVGREAPAAPLPEERIARPIGLALARATRSFAVPGMSLPPRAIAGAVAAIASRLTGAAYERWVARVLHAPWNAALLPPQPFDPEAVIELVGRSPIFARAFAPEVAAADRLFLRRLVERALAEGSAEELWAETRFLDRAAFAAGLAELRRAALEREVVQDLGGREIAGIGRIERLLAAIDRLHADPAAQRDLDALVLIADGLKRGGIAPAAAFEAALDQMTEPRP
jgi:hypothetical protein